MASELPSIGLVADGVQVIDTRMAGQPELNAVYVVAASEPCLIEAAPEADGPAVIGALAELGIGPEDLAHVMVTHIHMDHAGGAGALLARYPRATVWVHERGAPHLADPARLLLSTERTYGAERMRLLYGGMTPCPADRIRAVTDGDTIGLGDRSLHVLHTPGHASHHVALHDDRSGAMFTGEAIGSYLPWGPAFRPALPPPEVDVEGALASIDAMRAREPTSLLTSHFGPVPDPATAFERAVSGISTWSDAVRDALADRPDRTGADLVPMLTDLAREQLRTAAGLELADVIDRYDVLGSIRMNADGLARYWRERTEAGAAP